MLNKSERYGVLEWLKFSCKVGQLPFEVNLASWQLETPSISKQRISLVFHILFALHTLHKIVSLAYVFFFGSDVPLHQLVIHAVYASGLTVFGFWHYVSYRWDLSLFAAYVKITLQGTVGGSLVMEDQLKKHWTKRAKEYSMQDLIAVCLPYMVLLTIASLMAAYVYDSSMMFLLYNALPDQLRTCCTFCLCLLEELRVLLGVLSIATPTWQLQVMCSDLVSNQLQVLIRAIQNGTRNTESVHTSLRHLQLYVSIINDANSYIVFTWKQESLLAGTLTGYAAIAHFQEHPIFGIMYCVIFSDCILAYAVLYGKAFKIPRLFDQATSCALLHRGAIRSDVFKRQMKSIPPTGIKVGSFNQMERPSTLIFLNFILGNIVSMLVAWR